MAGLRQIVDPPTFTPIPYGLLTTVEFPATNDLHWQHGITYSPTCSAAVTGSGASTYDANCLAVTGAGGAPPTPPGLLNNVVQNVRGATSFEVYVEYDCSTVANEDAQRVATQALTMAEPWQVERVFWTGLAGGTAGTQTVAFPHLAAGAQVFDSTGILLQSAAINVTGTGGGGVGISGDLVNVATGLGLLEQGLANCYNGVGVIHIPELLVPTFDSWKLLKQVGPQLYTTNGNKVAVGAGYPGTAPDGTARAGNTCWMYATGNVFGYRSQVRVRAPQTSPSSLERSTNTRKMIAERTYVLGWDCCHFSVQVSLGVPKGT